MELGIWFFVIVAALFVADELDWLPKTSGYDRILKGKPPKQPPTE